MANIPLRSQVPEASNGTDVHFVDGLLPESEGRKGTTKAHHRKSRNGCQRCKARRVKCDEGHPVCGHCQRHSEACVYDPARPKTQEIHQPSVQSSSVASPSICMTDDDSSFWSESKSRRVRELKLMNRYNTSTGQSIFTTDDYAAEMAWVKAVPLQAFTNDALLFAMYALSALHMVELQPADRELENTYRQYLAVALSEHKKDVLDLNESNFDAVLLTSTLLRVIAFAMLRERPLVPYAPPIQWLEMNRGAMNLFQASWQWFKKDENSMAYRLTKRMPIVFDEEAKFAAGNREGLEHLLNRDDDDIANEPWPPDVMEAYETTVSYIGCVWIAMKEKEQNAEICRRLVIFPYIVRSRYIELVKEEQPRALATLAHYFALLHKFRGLWWIGGSPLREVHELEATLRGKWRDLMRWPLQQLANTDPGPSSTSQA